MTQATILLSSLKSTITPKRLALIVDRSGSMDGQPLTEALRFVTHIADCMTPVDALSVVVYDDKVNVLLPLATFTNPTRVRQAVANVTSGGMTDLFAGWEAGAKQLEGGVANHLRELAARDPEMMRKEVRFSAMRMSGRLSAKSEVRYSVDETDMVIPAFLRKKGQEGRGRKQQGSNPPNTPV